VNVSCTDLKVKLPGERTRTQRRFLYFYRFGYKIKQLAGQESIELLKESVISVAIICEREMFQ